MTATNVLTALFLAIGQSVGIALAMYLYLDLTRQQIVCMDYEIAGMELHDGGRDHIAYYSCNEWKIKTR